METGNQKPRQNNALLRGVNKPFIRILVALFLTATISESCKKNDVEDEDKFILSSINKTIDKNGGNINLPQVATVYFDANTFDKTIECKLYNSNNPTTQEDLKLAEALYGMSDRFNQEIRINTGKNEPKKTVKVEINLTDQFIAKVSGDLGIRAYAKLFIDDEEERTENFESLPTKYYASRKVLEIELNPEYFSNIWTNDETYEAIISVGITPGINPSAGRKKEECTGGVYISCPVKDCFVTSSFNPSRVHPVTKKPTPHRGADFRASVGTPVLAASDGKIIAAGYQLNPKNKTGWGNFIFIEHKNSEGQRFATLYAHLDKNLVTAGNVTEGQQIALSGQTGGVSGPHLHFEYVTNANIGDKEARVDPVPYIDSDSPRLISAVGSVLGVNSCSSGTRTSWKVVFNFKDPSNSIKQGGQLIFQDIEPVVNSPYSVPVNLLSSNNGAVSTDIFCARWNEYSYFKLKVFIRLANGKESNCIYFNLPKPAGALRILNDTTQPSSFIFK